MTDMFDKLTKILKSENHGDRENKALLELLGQSRKSKEEQQQDSIKQFILNLQQKQNQQRKAVQPKRSQDKDIIASIQMPSQSQNSKPYLNDYNVVKKLGEGGFGEVFLVEHKESKENYALKEIKLNKDNKADHLKIIEREINALSQLRNIHVIQLFSTYKTDDFVFLVMELASGGDLDQFIEKQTSLLDVNCVLLLFAQLIVTFDSVHSQGIFHQDIKPGNIFINDRHEGASLYRQYLQIGDFGLAVNQKERLEYSGTLAYMPPEKLQQENYDPEKADAWALGLILYEFCSQKSAFSSKEQLSDLIENKYDISTKLKFDASYNKVGIVEIFDALTKYDPAKRLSVRQLKQKAATQYKKLFAFIQLVENFDSDI